MPIAGRKIVSSFIPKLTALEQYFGIGEVFEYENPKTGRSMKLKVVESTNVTILSDCVRCALKNLCKSGFKPSCTDLWRDDRKNVYFEEI